MNGIIQDGTFKEIANYHGAPYGKICQLRYTDPKKKTGKMGCCKHRGSEGATAEEFWSWHRLYMGKKLQILANYIYIITVMSIFLGFQRGAKGQVNSE